MSSFLLGGSRGFSRNRRICGGLLLMLAVLLVACTQEERRGGSKETSAEGSDGTDNTAARAPTILTTDLSGESEVPGPGDEDGEGTAILQVDYAAQRVCYELSVEGISEASGAHLHRGAVDQAGPVVGTLQAPVGGSSIGCLDQSDLKTTLVELGDESGSFYVNVHNGDFPDGAVRGQLAPE